MSTKAAFITACGGGSTVIASGTAQTLADAMETALAAVKFPEDANVKARREAFWSACVASVSA